MSPSSSVSSISSPLQVRKTATVTWTAMILFLEPTSREVGCGQTSNCLRALLTTGEATETITEFIH